MLVGMVLLGCVADGQNVRLESWDDDRSEMELEDEQEGVWLESWDDDS